MSKQEKTGPLTGFRVVDLSAVVSGPLTAALLCDQGAEVIKVEKTTGDIQRHVGSKRNGFSGFFHVLNRGKRSIAADISTDAGRDIVHRLVSSADVVIQNFRPGVVDRLGIGYSELSKLNPKLVYLSISGFGPDGPNAKDRAYDPIIQAYSGIASVQGRIHAEHSDKPEQVNMLLLDKLTAQAGCQAITAALLERSKSGQGQHIELSMLDTAIAFSWADVAADLILQSDTTDPASAPSTIEQRPPIGASGSVHEFIDGWGAIMTLSQAEFEGMCAVYQLPHVLKDERFASLDARMNNRDAARELMQGEAADAARKLTVAQAHKLMRDHEVPFARVRTLAELPDDPQVQNNQMFRRLEHPIAGPLIDARPAPRFSRTPAAPGAPAPTIGQHTKEILAEIGLGEESASYFKQGIVR
jgi:crotonobetainyl-CoA:carnitine CoA-transferase CaiB-like acyl-CoA transferase